MGKEPAATIPKLGMARNHVGSQQAGDGNEPEDRDLPSANKTDGPVILTMH